MTHKFLSYVPLKLAEKACQFCYKAVVLLNFGCDVYGYNSLKFQYLYPLHNDVVKGGWDILVSLYLSDL